MRKEEGYNDIPLTGEANSSEMYQQAADGWQVTRRDSERRSEE